MTTRDINIAPTFKTGFVIVIKKEIRESSVYLTLVGIAHRILSRVTTITRRLIKDVRSERIG